MQKFTSKYQMLLQRTIVAVTANKGVVESRGVRMITTD